MRLILREATNVLRKLPGNLKTVGFPKAKQSCSQKFAENNKWHGGRNGISEKKLYRK